MELSKYIGDKIKYYREQKNMTQDELASLLNTTRQSISRYEKGERKANQDILFDLSEIFNLTIDDFFPQRKTLEDNSSKNIYGINNLWQQIIQESQFLEKNEQKQILDFIYDLKTNKKRLQLDKENINFSDLATDLSKVTNISVKELAKYTIKTIENTGNVRKQVQDLLKDCKIFVDEEKTNTAEFINVKRKIYEILLPLSMFIVAYENNITTVESFSNYFKLSREFLIEALSYYATSKGSIFEYNHHLIDLSNIPLEYSTIDKVNDSKIIVTTTNKKEESKKKRFFQ